MNYNSFSRPSQQNKQYEYRLYGSCKYRRIREASLNQISYMEVDSPLARLKP